MNRLAYFRWSDDLPRDWIGKGYIMWTKYGRSVVYNELPDEIPVDRSTFAQVLAGHGAFYIGPRHYIKEAGIGDMRVCCIRLTKEAMKEKPELSSVLYANVLGPDEKDEYVGMDKTGPVWRTKEGWVQQMTQELGESLHDRLPRAVIDMILEEARKKMCIAVGYEERSVS